MTPEISRGEGESPVGDGRRYPGHDERLPPHVRRKRNVLVLINAKSLRFARHEVARTGLRGPGDTHRARPWR